MSRFLKCLVLLTSIFLFYSFSYCETKDINSLVDDFQSATDLQKEKILSDNIGKDIFAKGTVANAGEYDFFNTTEDIKGTYYQVLTSQQKTKNNTPYQVIFLFRDKAKASDVSKGQDLQSNGKIIRISDERLQISVWLFCGDLSDEEINLFR